MDTKISTKEKLSVLWIVVMFTMVFADIFSFLLPEFLKDLVAGNTPIEITQELMLAMAVIIQIPILMIYLSRILKYKVNRWMNIGAGIVTILFVIGGGSPYLHYYFFATIETVCMLSIIWIAWKWSDKEIVVDTKI